MKTTLEVTEIDNVNGTWKISYPNNQDAEKIDGWLKRLSPGYVEYLIQFNTDPHCNACRDIECENVGMSDDACPGFKFGLEW